MGWAVTKHLAYFIPFCEGAGIPRAPSALARSAQHPQRKDREDRRGRDDPGAPHLPFPALGLGALLGHEQRESLGGRRFRLFRRDRRRRRHGGSRGHILRDRRPALHGLPARGGEERGLLLRKLVHGYMRMISNCSWP